MKIYIKQLNKTFPVISFLVLFVLLGFGGLTSAQTKTKAKSCPDKKASKKKTPKNYTKAKQKTYRSRITTRTVSATRMPRYDFNFRRINQSTNFTEKSIQVHKKVYVSLCVLRGNIKVNGWDRNEARVFIKGKKRSPVNFKVREKSPKDKMPVWVQVVGYNPKEVVDGNYNTCLSGDIELDIPRNATIKIQNTKGESETSVNSVRIANVEVLGGDIYLNNIANRITANTYQGGVSVRNSSGKMILSTTTGNIVASNTSSQDYGDYFKAKTRSGAITLQSVDQKEVESSSTTGSINYVGSVKPFGKYAFSTTNGSINLAIPKESSCRLTMSYGGSFQSELPLQDLFKERSGSLVYLKGRMGKGEANLNLKSFYGSIRIRERKSSVLASF